MKCTQPSRNKNLDSRKLKDNFVKLYKIECEISSSIRKVKQEFLQNYQAHHIVPVQVLKALEINESDYGDYNKETNCMLIPKYGDAIVHNGSHPIYNAFVLLYVEDMIDLFNNGNYLQKEIILGAAEWIKDEYNEALTKERNMHIRTLSMDDFAKIYLWDKYYPDVDIKEYLEHLKYNSQNK